MASIILFDIGYIFNINDKIKAMELKESKKALIRLTVSRNGLGVIYPEVEVNKEKTPHQTMKAAKIKWLNEYINRDALVRTVDNLVDGQALAKVKITDAQII